MKKNLVLFSIFIACFSSNAQSTFQVGLSRYDHVPLGWTANSMVRTSDNGYAIAGGTSSYHTVDSGDIFIAKLDSTGVLQWAFSIGGPSEEFATSIAQTFDGGYIVEGGDVNFSDNKIYIIKIDSSGNLQWTKKISYGNSILATAIIQTADSGYIVLGDSSDVISSFLFKLNVNGDVLWSKYLDGFTYGTTSIVQAEDHGYVISGNQFSVSHQITLFLAKLDSLGNWEWSRAIGGVENGVPSNSCRNLIKTYDNGYALVGSTVEFGAGMSDFYVLKFDSAGNREWIRTIGGSGDDRAYAITQSLDHGYVVVGSTTSSGVSFPHDVYTVKLDSTGNLKWSSIIGGLMDDVGYSIVAASDGGYVISGETDTIADFGSGNFIIKLDSLGNTCGNFSHVTSTIDTIGIVTDGFGTTDNITADTSASGGTQIFSGVITQICPSVLSINEALLQNFSFSVFPNPSNQYFTLKIIDTDRNKYKLIICDVAGREIERWNEISTDENFSFGENLNAGFYLAEVIQGDSKKVISIIKKK